MKNIQIVSKVFNAAELCALLEQWNARQEETLLDPPLYVRLVEERLSDGSTVLNIEIEREK